MLEGSINKNVEQGKEKPPIKEGVDFVFNQNPELASIGSKEEYSEYLESIFPESKILFRGDSHDLDSFKYSETRPTHFGRLKFGPRLKYGSGIYFSSDKDLAEKFSIQNNGKTYIVLVDFSKKVEFDTNDDFRKEAKDFLEKEGIKELGLDVDKYTRQKQKEGFILHIKTSPDEIIVGEHDKIHTVGSQKDINGFKNFVESRK